MRAHVHEFAQVGTGVKAEYVNSVFTCGGQRLKLGVFILDCSPL